jgi:hypothetical protein
MLNLTLVLGFMTISQQMSGLRPSRNLTNHIALQRLKISPLGNPQCPQIETLKFHGSRVSISGESIRVSCEDRSLTVQRIITRECCVSLSYE